MLLMLYALDGKKQVQERSFNLATIDHEMLLM